MVLKVTIIEIIKKFGLFGLIVLVIFILFSIPTSFQDIYRKYIQIASKNIFDMSIKTSKIQNAGLNIAFNMEVLYTCYKKDNYI